MSIKTTSFLTSLGHIYQAWYVLKGCLRAEFWGSAAYSSLFSWGGIGSLVLSRWYSVLWGNKNKHGHRNERTQTQIRECFQLSWHAVMSPEGTFQFRVAVHGVGGRREALLGSALFWQCSELANGKNEDIQCLLVVPFPDPKTLLRSWYWMHFTVFKT